MYKQDLSTFEKLILVGIDLFLALRNAFTLQKCGVWRFGWRDQVSCLLLMVSQRKLEEQMTREEYMRNLAVFYSGDDQNPYRLYGPEWKDLNKVCPHIDSQRDFKRMLRQVRKHIVYVPTPPVLASRCFHLLALHPSYHVDGTRLENLPYLQLVSVIRRGDHVPLWENLYIYEEYARDYAARKWGSELSDLSEEAEVALMQQLARQQKVA